MASLENLGYNVEWRFLECQKFGVPQLRKRIFIVGTKDQKVDMDHFEEKPKVVGDILEHNMPLADTHFTQCLLKHYKPDELRGKAIKDKRGGVNNIHSWDIGLKGEITEEQKIIVEKLFKERRKKHWAEEITDVSHMAVVDGQGIRKLTIREGLRMFGYPENYNLSMFKDDNIGLAKAFDLLGNTVVVPVVKAVADKLCDVYIQKEL